MNNQLTYDDKVALNENPLIPDINKVTADDMNEIKAKFNGCMNGSITMGNVRANRFNGEIANLPNPVVSGQPSKNLNDFTKQGTYNFDNGDSSYSNAPANDGIHILVVTNNGSYDWVVQEDYVLRWGTNPPVKYIRNYTPAGWSSWQSTT